METAKFLQGSDPEGTTENGAMTYKSTRKAVLDLFALGGALRSRSEASIQELVGRAWMEDPVLTLRCLFYIRDAREGVGERNTFRLAISRLAKEKLYGQSVVKRFFGDVDKVGLIPEYGRWDDLFALFDTTYEHVALEVIKAQYEKDVAALAENKPISLLSKWLPSINATSQDTRRKAFVVENALGLSHGEYRKSLSALRERLNVLERNMSSGDYESVNYSMVPSVAFLRHMKAFKRNDTMKFSAFMDAAKSGETKVNTSVLFPADVVHLALKGETPADDLTLIWDSLPDYLGNAGEQALVVTDTSGSMNTKENKGKPLEVALSLALYYAERNLGPWKDHFITFSECPTMERILGSTITERIRNLSKAEWGSSTSLESAIRMILDTGLRNGLKGEEMPKKLYVVSDMEFDQACGNEKTNFEALKAMYAKAGYSMPQVVFWNVDSRNDNVPVKFDESGVALVSGYSAAIFKSLVGRQDFSPEKFMLEVLNGERYARVL